MQQRLSAIKVELELKRGWGSWKKSRGVFIREEAFTDIYGIFTSYEVSNGKVNKLFFSIIWVLHSRVSSVRN